MDEEVTEEIEEREDLVTKDGYQCAACGNLFEDDPELPSLNSFMSPEMPEMGEMGEEMPPPVTCPDCG